MENKIIEAADRCEHYRLCGYHCSESSIRAISETLSMDIPEVLLKSSCGFRGGGGGSGGRCGIVEIGILLISFIYGRTSPEESIDGYSYLVRTLIDRFVKELGSDKCNVLQPLSMTNTPDNSCSIVYRKGTMIVSKLLLEADELLLEIK